MLTHPRSVTNTPLVPTRVFEFVLVGIDRSPESLEAARQAASLVEPDGRLSLLAAWSLSPLTLGTLGPMQVPDADEEEFRGSFASALADAESVAGQTRDGTPRDSALVRGTGSAELLAKAREGDVTLLVVGSHRVEPRARHPHGLDCYGGRPRVSMFGARRPSPEGVAAAPDRRGRRRLAGVSRCVRRGVQDRRPLRKRVVARRRARRQGRQRAGGQGDHRLPPRGSSGRAGWRADGGGCGRRPHHRRKPRAARRSGTGLGVGAARPSGALLDVDRPRRRRLLEPTTARRVVERPQPAGRSSPMTGDGDGGKLVQ